MKSDMSGVVGMVKQEHYGSIAEPLFTRHAARAQPTFQYSVPLRQLGSTAEAMLSCEWGQGSIDVVVVIHGGGYALFEAESTEQVRAVHCG
jgi:hypothetical protein